MARKILIAGNWKMNSNLAEARLLAGQIGQAVTSKHTRPGFEVACLPPYVYLPAVAETLKGGSVKWGAQDISPENAGAFTGDVSALMLKDFGCHYVVVGHSERRAYHGEGNPVLKKKIARAREHGVTPIICVGEPLPVRQLGTHAEHVRSQLEGLLDEIAKESAAWTGFVLAYEPIWAIGTGEVATPQQAQDMGALARKTLAGMRREWEQTSILYGGSVKSSNALELSRKPDVDGFLVGGASLQAAEFNGIIGHAFSAKTA